MKEEKYSEEELEEIREIVRKFRKANFFRLPSFRGNKVASLNPESKVRNFSTITGVFQLSTGRWIFIVYSYPLSVVHRIVDGLAKWATEKYCIKVISPRKWRQAFINNSFIPIIPVKFRNVVVMPYIENENFWDILTSNLGNYTLTEKESMIMGAAKVINEMHSRGVVWGELIVNNIVRAENGEMIICDTETVYYRGTIVEQKASDWLDFICSACGSIKRDHPEQEIESLVQEIFEQIQEISVRQHLKARCGRKRTLLHFFFYTGRRLTCSVKLYDQIKRKINSLPIAGQFYFSLRFFSGFVIQ